MIWLTISKEKYPRSRRINSPWFTSSIFDLASLDSALSVWPSHLPAYIKFILNTDFDADAYHKTLGTLNDLAIQSVPSLIHGFK
jgi:hypothetical protein